MALTAYDERTYWEARYSDGGTSGAGSYGYEAAWKLDYIVRATCAYDIEIIVDVGCGDGNFAFGLLNRLQAITYIGYDIARTVVARNIKRALADRTLRSRVKFDVSDGADLGDVTSRADMVLCIDVLHHARSSDQVDKLLDSVLRAKQLVALTYWAPEAADSDQAASPHCFYHPYSHPEGWVTLVDEPVPGDAIKRLTIIRRAVKRK